MTEEAFESEVQKARKKAELYLISKYQLNYFDIQDVLQNASIKAFKNLVSFKGDSSFCTWYISIAKNEAKTFLLKKQKSKEIQDSDPLLKNYSFVSVEPEVYLSDKIEDYKSIINKAMTSLSKNHKDVLNLIFKDSFSHKEISLKLKIPISSVRTRLFYAKKTLRKAISFYALN